MVIVVLLAAAYCFALLAAYTCDIVRCIKLAFDLSSSACRELYQNLEIVNPRTTRQCLPSDAARCRSLSLRRAQGRNLIHYNVLYMD